MKKSIKALSVIFVMFTLVCIMMFSANAETVTGECGLEGDNLTWTFDTETGVLTIVGEGEMDNYSLYNNINKTNAPWWDYYSQMTELVIGDKVTSIGDYAFYNCDTLTSLEIPDNVKTIGDYAFYDCDLLESFTIPEKVKTIGDYTFYSCAISGEMVISDGVTSIGKWAFADCNIENLKIGNGLTELSYAIFEGCDKLKNIEWGENLKIISGIAFQGCDEYNNIVIPNGVEVIGNNAFCISSPISVSLPLSIKSIGERFVTTRESAQISIFYGGTIEEWEKISIADDNEPLKNATFHFGHSHSYTSGITTESTCLTTGVKTYTCECGETYTRTLSALGHDVVIDSAVSATCTETGLTQGEHCSRCDYKVAQEETPSLGHDEVIIPAVNATCTKAGLTEGVGCSRCDTIFTAQEATPTIDHEIAIAPAVAPTCTSIGLTEGKACKICGTVFAGQEEVPVLGHDIIIDSAASATCTETGLTEGKHCSRCDYKVAQKKTPALGHTETFTEYVEATCTESGLSVGKKCSVCDEVIIPQQIIPAKGHKLTDWIITSEATCEANGKKIKLCSCGLSEEEVISAIGHSDTDNDGKCDNCSVSLVEEPEQPKEEANVFSFLTDFLGKLFDFIKKLFGIK